MSRVLNFSAGPSMMPEWVLQKAQSELMEYKNSGQSVLEMSHRSADFTAIIQDCERRLRSLMQIPDNYKVLFLQGGASLQFAMIPMNLLKKYKRAALINTGAWSKKAMKELAKIGECVLVADSESDNFTYIPKEYEIPKDIDYFYICENNTIYGTKYKQLPDTKGVPLIADMSSCILSEPVDVNKYGMIFAGAQKNMGPAGLTVIIIREDLLEDIPEGLPTMLDYRTHVKGESMFNTPPTFAIYICDLMLQWLEEEIGGLTKMKEINERKAALLYDYLDHSKMFNGPVAKEDRSLMNIPFVTGDKDLDAKFIKEAKEKGFVNIKGHRSVGGMRASIYNAMTYEGVQQLVAFMEHFERENS